jgi:hypothetical protein
VLGFQDRVAECCGGAVPVPDSDNARGVFAALLTNVKVADAVPVALGVKFTSNVLLVPDAIVNGNVRPLKEYSLLEEAADDTVTLAPVALKVAVLVALRPTTVLAKLKAVGFAARCPWAVPDPESGTVRLERSVEIANDPALAPEVTGEKLTLKVALCPALNVRGNVGPVTL